MPDPADRTARLFYDDTCGPCSLLARATEGVSRHRVLATPLGDVAADGVLGGLPSEQRYASAHLASDGALWSGDAIAAPLLGATFGPTIGRIVRRSPPLGRSVRWAYLRLWRHRQTHGCGARGTVPRS